MDRNVTSYYLCDCGSFWTYKYTHPTRKCRYCNSVVKILFSSNVFVWIIHKCKDCNLRWKSTELITESSRCNRCGRMTKTKADWLYKLVGLTDEYVVTKKYFDIIPNGNRNDELEKIKLKIIERIKSIKKNYQIYKKQNDFKKLV